MSDGPDSLRILFSLSSKGYLSRYGEAMNLLAERGHVVRLTYLAPDKHADVDDVPVGAPPSTGVSPLPATGPPTRWSRLAEDLRVTIDYIRFLDAQYESAELGRRRMEPSLPRAARPLTRVRSFPRRRISRLVRAYRALELAIPTDPAADALLRSERPDLVVVSPGLMRGRGRVGVSQTDHIKSALRMGIPVVLAVPSWDHLTFKGLIKLEPDAVTLWNERQRDEAVELHGIPPEKVIVTGAQDLDQWFDRRPSLSREGFAAQVGLRADRPYLLFLGSSKTIAKGDDEVAFVRRWIAAIRASEDPAVAGLGVLIRPHPGNIAHWTDADVSDLENVAIWPRTRPDRWAVDEEALTDKFHSLHFSVGAVGINTTAMIEAGIIGRPVFTIRAPEFAHTQEGTIHFRHLVAGAEGGLLQDAGDFPTHLAQVAAALSDNGAGRGRIARFIEEFVRPRGLGQATVPVLADALERVARGTPRSTGTGSGARAAVLRTLLWPLAWWLSRR